MKAEYLKTQQAADKLKDGTLDAFFSVSGWPNGAISELAVTTGIDLVPIAGPEADGLVKKFSFFATDAIPDDAYKNTPGVKTVSVNALWVTSIKQSEALIYAITAALWNANTRKLLDSGPCQGQGHPPGRLAAGPGDSAAPGGGEILQGKGHHQVRPDRGDRNALEG